MWVCAADLGAFASPTLRCIVRDLMRPRFDSVLRRPIGSILHCELRSSCALELRSTGLLCARARVCVYCISVCCSPGSRHGPRASQLDLGDEGPEGPRVISVTRAGVIFRTPEHYFTYGIRTYRR